MDGGDAGPFLGVCVEYLLSSVAVLAEGGFDGKGKSRSLRSAAGWQPRKV